MHVHLGLTALGASMELRTALVVVVVVYAVSPHTHQPLGVPQELSGSSHPSGGEEAEDKAEGIGSPDIWEDEKAEDLRREIFGTAATGPRSAQCA